MNKVEQKKLKKILLVRLRLIGDVIMTTPALRILKETFPNSFISYVVETEQKEIIEGNPSIDKLIVLKRKSSLIEFLKFIKSLRKERYDVAIDFHGGPKASLIAFFSRADLKIGYNIPYRKLLYDIHVRRKTDKPIHSIESQINLLKPMGIDIKSIPPVYIPDANSEEKIRIEKILNDNYLKNYKRVLLHVSAGNEFRDWGIDNIKKFIKYLSQEESMKVILVGSEKDLDRVDYLKNEKNVYSLVGKLNLKELREIIIKSDVFVGPDSGPMHLASTTRTPIIALFGPTIPEIFGPWSENAFVIQKNFDCRPCKQKKCEKEFICIRSISPEEVFEKVKNTLNINGN
ncbi:MAG: glycosyltransferase family 9 protein [Acidobacteriota bacterium]